MAMITVKQVQGSLWSYGNHSAVIVLIISTMMTEIDFSSNFTVIALDHNNHMSCAVIVAIIETHLWANKDDWFHDSIMSGLIGDVATWIFKFLFCQS